MTLRTSAPLIVSACLCVSSSVFAQERSCERSSPICVPDCIKHWLCDDYRAKPIPCPTSVRGWECDCYQPKPLPCPVSVKRFYCDNYCPKPLPSLSCATSSSRKCVSPLWGPMTAMRNAESSACDALYMKTSRTWNESDPSSTSDGRAMGNGSLSK
ncbi:hypothetical protein VN12_10085 [Pirellula sp. SH-Sr6A]|nr:hypothetical protein VN12_10085 [Pirellula sp. SH-Sr6A]